MLVLCFGDSNTYGCDPRSPLGERYAPEHRWVDILAAGTGWDVRNLGQNGREIPPLPPNCPADTDLLIVMLGTNDLLRGCPPAEAAGRLERFLAAVPLPGERVLLIAPPPLCLGTWVPSPQLAEDSRRFAHFCRALAARLGIRFADAGAWGIPMAHDGVHFTEVGNHAFAAGLLSALRGPEK